jgi:aspartyl protease family protein
MRSLSNFANFVKAILPALAAAATAFASPLFAADINLIGIFGDKATLMVDGGKPRTLAVGETSPEKIRLLSVAADTAVVEIDGKRETLRLGNQRIAAARNDGKAQRAVLTGDAQGHFFTTVVVNGASLQMMVDTGATSIAISTDAARRANVRYVTAERGLTQTANGVVAVYRVKFDTVKIGDITLNNVDGTVMEGEALMRFGLLGMSFLSRTEMRRDGDSLTLTKRY